MKAISQNMELIIILLFMVGSIPFLNSLIYTTQQQEFRYITDKSSNIDYVDTYEQLEVTTDTGVHTYYNIPKAWVAKNYSRADVLLSMVIIDSNIPDDALRVKYSDAHPMTTWDLTQILNKYDYYFSVSKPQQGTIVLNGNTRYMTSAGSTWDSSSTSKTDYYRSLNKYYLLDDASQTNYYLTWNIAEQRWEFKNDYSMIW